MNRYRFFLLIISLVLASCNGTPPDPDDWQNYDWCYYYSFGEEWYAPFMPHLTHIPGESGSYTEIGTGGFEMYQGDLIIPPLNTPTNFNISVSRVEIYIERAESNEFEDNTGNIPLYGAANIHGWEIVANDTLPNIGGSDVMFGSLAFNRDFGVYQGTNTISLDLYSYTEGDGQAIEDRKNIILNEIRIYGQGESPFSVNPCGDVRPTSTPISSNTPVGTATGVPACWGQEWNFTFSPLEFSGAARINGYGFVSSLQPDGTTTSISISRVLEESSPIISYIRVRYRVTEPPYNSGDISLYLDEVEVASQDILDAMPNNNGDRFLEFDLRPLLFSFDEIEVSAIVGESSPPAGEIFIEGIEVFGLGVAPEPSLYLEPTYYNMACPSYATNTPAPTVSPTPTPTGTSTTCFRLDYDYRISAYDALDQPIHSGEWVAGVGLIPQEFHPNSSQWAHRYSIRAQGNGLPIRRIEFEFSSLVPGTGMGDWQLNLFSGSINVMEIYPEPATFFSWDGEVTGGSVRFGGYIGNDQTNPASNPGGSAVLQRITIFGVGTPTGWQGVLTTLPCWDITPTPTLTATTTPSPFPATATRTPSNTPTRTPIPSLESVTPTYTPLIVASPTPSNIPSATPTRTATNTSLPPTATRTPSPTRTPRPPSATPFPTSGPTDTVIPLPTDGSETPGITSTPTPEMTTTPTSVDPYDFGSVPGQVTFGTFVGTPDYAGTVIPVPGELGEYHSEVYNGLGTAAAHINELPASIVSFVPDIDGGLNSFSGYAKWVMSGTSLQEIFGLRLYLIATHAFYGILIAIVISSIDLIIWIIVLIMKFISWIIQKILNAIPFVG